MIEVAGPRFATGPGSIRQRLELPATVGHFGLQRDQPSGRCVWLRVEHPIVRYRAENRWVKCGFLETVPIRDTVNRLLHLFATAEQNSTVVLYHSPIVVLHANRIQ